MTFRTLPFSDKDDVGDSLAEVPPFAVPLTDPQLPIWIDQSLHFNKPIYNVGQTLTLRTAIDKELFVKALRTVVAENDALRLQFVDRGLDCFQLVDSDIPFDVPFRDFSEESKPEQSAKSWIEAIFWEPLGPSDFPLFRFALAKVGSDRFIWLQKYHHLITDATGRWLIAVRVAAVYDALSAGIAVPAADAGTYLSIGRARDSYIGSSDWTIDQAYWRTRFTDIPQPLIKGDPRLSDKSRSGRPHQVPWRLPRDTSVKLRAFARAQGSSVNKVLLTLVWCCLSRLYGRPDLVLGVPLANRKSPAERQTVGHFSKVMPFRPRINGEMTLAAAISALDRDLSEDLKHQRFPFHSLNRLLTDYRGFVGLYDVIVNFQRNDYGFSLGGAKVSCENLSVGFAVPLSIAVFDYATEGALDFVVAYDQGRLSSKEVTRFVACLQELLHRAAEHADTPLGALPIVSAQDRAAILRAGYGERVTLPAGATLATLLADQAARTPNSTALICRDERLTYGELHERADRLADLLVAAGVGPDVLVGICHLRTIGLIVAVLAVHKAGGAYLPLDPNYPEHRLAFMLEDSKAHVVLTDRACAPLLTRTGAQLIMVDDSAEAIPAMPVATPRMGAQPDHLAYVLYTSGSTGVPKGIGVTHNNAVNLMVSCQGLVRGKDLAGVLFATSLNFDISAYEIFVPLASGGAIIMVDDLFGLATATARNEVSLINTVPSLMTAYLEEFSLPAGIQVVNLAGEALSRALADRIFDHLVDVRLFNLYGPTETTVYSTWSAIEREDNQLPPIGVPLFNTEAYVLDERMQLVPLGCMGELWIGGMGVSRGYLNLGELTKERFVPNPFGEGKIYKTGDLATWRSDGQLQFGGRIDHQVKIHGCRIELGEIESVLKLHPAVRESLLVVMKDATFNEKLVAYVATPDFSSSILIGELRNLVKQRLPSYMMPSAIVLIDAFPTTPNGKLDRGALPAPDVANPEFMPVNVAPRTPTEQVLADIWCDVLGLERVGVRENFLELGGHSLMLVRLIGKIERMLNVRLGISEIFRNPTVEEMAKSIQALRVSYPAGVVEIREGTSGRPIFCFPGMGGTGLQFSILSAKLNTKRPILGIELHELKAGNNAFVSIERIAQAVVQRMRQVQPVGPYTMIGYSFGGHLAFEVARQLTAAEHSLESLIMLDAYVPGSRQSVKGVRKLAAHWRTIKQLNFTESRAYVSSRIQKRLLPRSKEPGDGIEVPSPDGDAIERQIREVSDACVVAFGSYRHKVFTGRIVLFKATDLGDWTELVDPTGTCGWTNLCEQGVDVIAINCRHLDMFEEPNITAVANHLNRLLNAIVGDCIPEISALSSS